MVSNGHLRRSWATAPCPDCGAIIPGRLAILHVEARRSWAGSPLWYADVCWPCFPVYMARCLRQTYGEINAQVENNSFFNMIKKEADYWDGVYYRIPFSPKAR